VPIAESILQWLEEQRFITNATKIRSDPSSAQYRAIEWLASTHSSNFTTIFENNATAMVQRYVLVTLYYTAGGDTGKWFNDRLWLTSESVCDWGGITCVGSYTGDADNYYSHQGRNNCRTCGLNKTTVTLNEDVDVIVTINLGTTKSLAGPKIDIDSIV
jgi:hypothetical protein